MASSPQNNNNPPIMTSRSYRRRPWESGELRICLNSKSSVGANAGRRPHMLVDVTMSFFMMFAVPSPVEGGYYNFGSYIAPIACYSLPVDDPSLHFSTLDASQEAIASLVTSGRGFHGEILRLLGPDVSRLAHATVSGAVARGHTAMKVHVDADYILWVDWAIVERIADHYRPMNRRRDGGEPESLGTCPVCLDEIKKEWIWPVRLGCSHIFHLGCVSRWLQRQNSCPMCRSEQNIVIMDYP